MSNKEFDFQKELVSSIFNAGPEVDRKELLTDIFKHYVAKMFEYTLSREKENRLSFEALVLVKRNLINEFRKAELSEYQRTTEQYENLFEETVQEILQEAASSHAGKDRVSVDKTLQINPEKYIHEGGLFVPKHMKN